MDKRSDTRANGTRRDAIRPGCIVDIVLKEDQRSGKVTRGIVQDLLTNSATHPHGIKVRLRDGRVGRVACVIGTEESSGTGH
ncbi:conserved hypothetical protein [Methanoregula boonei 6A8]|jgi:uncharacterized repeat protein (TIGR03833 family)|uniref:YwbE family protein n=1 Tax=Methanoregula boonei (strain DSM 21154 / JCM 14090 / 6A8) TaxID=456442 RepID=A7I6K7_METB6|nr:YwbE family protein [Methanoregula boonei]ABS55368.1 conserved hypothetical protein [Methanoregula boonei 6A8]